MLMLRVGQNVIGWKGVAAPLPSKGERKWHLKSSMKATDSDFS